MSHKLEMPKQSLGELCEVHQTLLELNRRYPDDVNITICLAEAERQRDIAWLIHRESKSSML